MFVDEESFRGAVACFGCEGVLRERFAGDFGHWNRVGNRIIVSNLIETVFDPLFGD